MTLRQRLLSLVALLVLGFGVATTLLQVAESQERHDLHASLQAEFAHTADHIVTFTGAPLKQFVDDYSRWDDMVTFLHQPDPAWADVNLVEVIDSFDVDVMWVLGLEGQVRYRVSRDDYDTIPLPVEPDGLVELVQHSIQPWFFAPTEAGLLELRGAPIQPSDTEDRSAPALGWFFVGRIWHEERLDRLAETLGGFASLYPGLERPAAQTDETILRATRELDDHRGKLLGRLVLEKTTAALAIRERTDRDELAIFALFGGVMVVLISVALRQWVLKPLQAIEDSLQRDSPAGLTSLTQTSSEFGRLARLVSGSFAHKKQLAEAIARRKSVAAALQESEQALRQTIAERVQLGRDLHDSVIQTLYASGMGLASARNQLKTAPEKADNRLQIVQSRLNDTIRELRLFITGLEPEDAKTVVFSQTVARLTEFVCESNGVATKVDIDDATSERLSPHHRAQLLQVIREALSNVVRHADARHVGVILNGSGAVITLEITDDGRGLPVAEPATSSRGLTNIRERISAMGGVCRFETIAGKGTRLWVKLNLTGGPTDT